eukprot:15665910-Heterocapsa_arctica.AAC.1
MTYPDRGRALWPEPADRSRPPCSGCRPAKVSWRARRAAAWSCSGSTRGPDRRSRRRSGLRPLAVLHWDARDERGKRLHRVRRGAGKRGPGPRANESPAWRETGSTVWLVGGS